MPKKKTAIIEYRNYYLPPDFPALLLSGDYWRISEKPSGRLHFHNCLELGLCHSDGGILQIGDTQLVFKSGDITCIPRHIPHTTFSHPGTASHWSYLFVDTLHMFLHLLPESWDGYDMAASSLFDHHFIHRQDEHPDVHGLAHLIFREMEEEKADWRISVRSLLLALFIMLYRRQEPGAAPGGTGPRQDPSNILLIAPALDHIEKYYGEGICVESLATLCGFSVTHFRRLFGNIMGVSPLEYLNNVRLMKACALLRSSEDSILDISEAVGFSCVSSLNRYFSRVMQTTPRDYRKQMILAKDKQPILEYAGWLYPEIL